MVKWIIDDSCLVNIVSLSFQTDDGTLRVDHTHKKSTSPYHYPYDFVRLVRQSSEEDESMENLGKDLNKHDEANDTEEVTKNTRRFERAALDKYEKQPLLGKRFEHFLRVRKDVKTKKRSAPSNGIENEKRSVLLLPNPNRMIMLRSKGFGTNRRLPRTSVRISKQPMIVAKHQARITPNQMDWVLKQNKRIYKPGQKTEQTKSQTISDDDKIEHFFRVRKQMNDVILQVLKPQEEPQFLDDDVIEMELEVPQKTSKVEAKHGYSLMMIKRNENSQEKKDKKVNIKLRRIL